MLTRQKGWKLYFIWLRINQNLSHVETDHSSFINLSQNYHNIHLESKHNNNDKLTRWITKLVKYDHELVYKPGKDNVVADFLSRAVYWESKMQNKTQYATQKLYVIIINCMLSISVASAT
jgi:hypothetical protein